MHHAPADCINVPGEATAESGRMALELTDAELATAATACRAMAYQEGERAHRSSPYRSGTPPGFSAQPLRRWLRTHARQPSASRARQVLALPTVVKPSKVAKHRGTKRPSGDGQQHRLP